MNVMELLGHRVQIGSGAHLTSYPMGTGDFSLELKRPGREADHSPPPSTRVKNALSYPSTSPYVFLIKYRMRLHGVVLSQA
jgi:hypothetical protein